MFDKYGRMFYIFKDGMVIKIFKERLDAVTEIYRPFDDLPLFETYKFSERFYIDTLFFLSNIKILHKLYL